MANPQFRTAWSKANEEVRVAEERLARAWAAFASGEGGPPDKELLAEVARLRRECDKRLAALLEQLSGERNSPAPKSDRGEHPQGSSAVH